MAIKQPKSKVINGKTFFIYPVGLFQRLHLDRQVLKMIAPVVKGLGDDLNLSDLEGLLKKKLNIGKIMDGVMDGLSALSEEEYETFIMRLLEKVQVQVPGKQAVDFASSPESIEDVFSDDLFSLYELLFEAMKENKLSPFALMSRGNGILGTNTSEKNPVDETQPGTQ